ncbi:MAG: hypothetical protein JKY01_11335 [Pseudomonadales bacterium]|nr:hypothetical protein [Pseudomonadales bacterium]
MVTKKAPLLGEKSAKRKPEESEEKKHSTQEGQYGFVPVQGERGKRKFRYVESSEVAKGCKLCK